MKVAVVYYSKSGNTKKVAEAMANELGTGAESTKDEPELEGVDLLFIGSGCYGGKLTGKTAKFLEGLKDIKRAAVFGTYLGETKAIESMKEILEKKGVEVIDKWGCSGAFLYLMNRGRPNEKDLELARQFANSVLEKAMESAEEVKVDGKEQGQA